MRKDGIKNGQARPSDKPIKQGELDYAPHFKKDMRKTPSEVLNTSSYEY